MLKTLIKKQYQECFRSYFVNPKTGKRRSKWGIFGMFVFFTAVMLFLAVFVLILVLAIFLPMMNMTKAYDQYL